MMTRGTARAYSIKYAAFPSLENIGLQGEGT
jgi:hypothetical protein